MYSGVYKDVKPLFFNQEVTCLVNPRVGREYENSMNIVEKAKKVMIVEGTCWSAGG